MTELLDVTVEITGEPVPKKRARVVDGRAFTPAETVAYEQAIGWAWREQHHSAPAEGPIRVSVAVRECNRPPQRRGDLDNYVKSALDALNGLAWKDDRQVTWIEAHINREAAQPGMVIEVEELLA